MTPVTEILTASRSSENRLIAGVCLAHLMSHYYMMLLAPLFIFIRADFGVSYTELGLALTAFNLVSAVLQTPVGFLVDRVGARINLAGGLLLGAGAVAVAGIAESYWLFVAMFAVLGLANTVYHPADYALLSERVAPARMTQVFSFHTCSGMIGSAMAPATLLFMQGLVGWRGAFLCAAAVGVVTALTVLLQDLPPLVHHAELTPTPHGDRAASARSDGLGLLLSAPILLNLVFFFVLSMLGSGLNQYLVVGLEALHGTPPALSNAALTGLLAMSAAGVLFGGALAGRTANHNLVTAIGRGGDRRRQPADRLCRSRRISVGPGDLAQRLCQRHGHAVARHDRPVGDSAGRVRQGVRLRDHRLPYRRRGVAGDLRAVSRPRRTACAVHLHRGVRRGCRLHRVIRHVGPTRGRVRTCVPGDCSVVALGREPIELPALRAGARRIRALTMSNSKISFPRRRGARGLKLSFSRPDEGRRSAKRRKQLPRCLGAARTQPGCARLPALHLGAF